MSNRNRDGVKDANLPLLQSASGLVLILVIYSVGWKSSVLILVSTALILLNPWVRILLELPPATSSANTSKSSLSRFDPAHYLSSFHFENDAETEPEQPGKPSDPSTKSASFRKERKVNLSVLPPPIRSRLKVTVPLIVRDFVKYWYDPLTFAHPSFPSEASATVEHLCGSVYLRVKKKRTVDVATNLLLTSCSVVLSALRARRTEASLKPKPTNPNPNSSQPQPPSANPSLPPIHSWNSTSSRIQSLRTSIQKFLSIHLPSESSSSLLVLSVLTEILTKQLWGVIQIIGDPDWINRKIVESSQKVEEGELEGLNIQRNNGFKSPELDVDPLADKELLLKAQREAKMDYQAQTIIQQQPHSQSRMGMNMNPNLNRSNEVTPQATSFPKPALPNRPIHASSSNSSNAADPSTRLNSTDPFISLGNLGMSALGSVGKAAGKTVGMLEGAVGEVGNSLMGGEASMPESTFNESSNPSRQSFGSQETEAGTGAGPRSSIQRRKPVPSNPDQGETIRRPPSNFNSDLPKNGSTTKEPPLPESIRSSIRDDRNQSNEKSVEGYEIRESRAPPNLPPRTPTPSSATTFDLSKFPPLSSVLSREISDTYDRFESFLENIGTEEGESLLRLHTQIETLAQISKMSSPDEATFRTDALVILEKARMNLSDNSEIKYELNSTLEKLQIQGNGNMKTLDGLKSKVDDGLERFYKIFCEKQQERTDQQKDSGRLSAPATPFNPSTPSSRSTSTSSTTSNALIGRSNSPGLNYVARGTVPKPQPETPAPLNYTPRKKNSLLTSNSSDSNQMGFIAAEENLFPPTPSNQNQPSVSEGLDTGAVTGDSSFSSSGNRISLDRNLAGESLVKTSTPVRTSSPPLISDQKQERPPYLDQPSSSSSSSSTSSSALSLEVSVTDVSPSSSGPNTFIDPRNLELMVAVEGMAASGGGFVLVRRWTEFEALDSEFKKSTSIPNSIIPSLPLFKPRSQTSFSACQLIENYLVKLLSNPQLIELEITKRFVDKTRAGAGAEMDVVKSKGGPKAFISGMGNFGGTLGRTVAIGASSVGAAVGNVGKSASQKSGLGIGIGAVGGNGIEKSRSNIRKNTSSNLNGLSNLENSSSLSISSSRSSSPTSSNVSPPLGISNSSLDPMDSDLNNNNSTQSSNSKAPLTSSQPPPDSEISAQDLDALLSAVFSVADEAFDLSGGWTFRRGMLRVLEQIVRATYGGTIINAFNHTAQSLSSESLGNHLEGITDSFWPLEKSKDGEKKDEASSSNSNSNDLSKRIWDSTPTPERSLKEREYTSKAAREIFLSWTPSQAAYLLGPGGKQSSEKALSTIHRELENPITALDLSLTLVLRILEIFCE